MRGHVCGDDARPSLPILSPVSLDAKVDLSYFVEPTIPTTLVGDDLRIRQVVTNILGNAIKFSSGTEGGGKVSLSANVRDVNDDRTRLPFAFVTTESVWMPIHRPEFQPFEQADNAITRRFGGTGLGLVISIR